MEAGQFCPVYLFMKYYFTVIIILILDQTVKYKIRTTLAVGERINIISGIFEITNISNSGAAWGSFAESTFILAVISAIISVGILMVIGMNEKLHKGYKYSLSLVAAGGLGNVADRVFFGTVTDMFSLPFFSPVFNVADISICLGCFSIVALVFLEDKLKGIKR